MPYIRRNMHVPYTVEQMYSLVNDVEKYPEFLPWCEACKILSQSDNQVMASVTISKAGLNRTFSTINRLEPNSRITVHLQKGMFSNLEGVWTFHSKGEGSEIEFSLNYEFGNPLLKLTFGRLIDQLANSVVSAFAKRAKDVYEC